MANLTEYKANPDGTFTRMRSDPKPLQRSQLLSAKANIESSQQEMDTIKNLTTAQALTVFRIVDRFRKPLEEQTLTWEEAVMKVAAPWDDELAALDAALVEK